MCIPVQVYVLWHTHFEQWWPSNSHFPFEMESDHHLGKGGVWLGRLKNRGRPLQHQGSSVQSAAVQSGLNSAIDIGHSWVTRTLPNCSLSTLESTLKKIFWFSLAWMNALVKTNRKLFIACLIQCLLWNVAVAPSRHDDWWEFRKQWMECKQY